MTASANINNHSSYSTDVDPTAFNTPNNLNKFLLKKLLAPWVAEGSHSEFRQEAARRIIDCYTNQWTHLDLYGQSLQALPLDALAELTQLQSINLNKNNLTSLPEGLCKLTKLHTIDLGSNKLSGLPRDIRELTSLRTLNLRFNNITTADFVPNVVENIPIQCKILTTGNPCDPVDTALDFKVQRAYKNYLSPRAEGVPVPTTLSDDIRIFRDYLSCTHYKNEKKREWERLDPGEHRDELIAKFERDSTRLGALCVEYARPHNVSQSTQNPATHIRPTDDERAENEAKRQVPVTQQQTQPQPQQLYNHQEPHLTQSPAASTPPSAFVQPPQIHVPPTNLNNHTLPEQQTNAERELPHFVPLQQNHTTPAPTTPTLPNVLGITEDRRGFFSGFFLKNNALKKENHGLEKDEFDSVNHLENLVRDNSDNRELKHALRQEKFRKKVTGIFRGSWFKPSKTVEVNHNPNVQAKEMSERVFATEQSVPAPVPILPKNAQSAFPIDVAWNHEDIQQNHPRTYVNRYGEVKTAITNRPTCPSTEETWDNANQVATFVPKQGLLRNVGGITFKPFLNNEENKRAINDHINKLAKTTEATIKLPPELINASEKNHLRAGVIVSAPDGRIVVVESNNHHFVSATFPQGEIDESIHRLKGISHERKLELAAIKEAYEESGLKVELEAYIGDFDIGSNRYRIFAGNTKEGNPANMDSESQSVSLVPQNLLEKFFRKANAETDVRGWESTPKHRSEGVLNMVRYYGAYSASRKIEEARMNLLPHIGGQNVKEELSSSDTKALSDALRAEAKSVRDINHAASANWAEPFLITPKELLHRKGYSGNDQSPRRATAIRLNFHQPDANRGQDCAYIHANKIDFGGGEDALQYIAAQRPHTAKARNKTIEGDGKIHSNNFWRAVAQENVSVVVDLTQDSERTQFNEGHYGPSPIKPYQDGQVNLKIVSRVEDKVNQLHHEVMQLDVEDSNREIKRIHFTGWKDKTVIAPQALIDLAALVKNDVASQSNNMPAGAKPTVLIHCRHGIGRTGTLMSFMAASEILDKKKIITEDDLMNVVVDVVRRGRMERGAYFVSTDQFPLLVNALKLKYFGKNAPAQQQPNSIPSAPLSPVTTSSNPIQSTRSVQRPDKVGIPNVGDTCYMNTALQTLAMLRPVRNALSSIPERLEQNAPISFYGLFGNLDKGLAVSSEAANDMITQLQSNESFNTLGGLRQQHCVNEALFDCLFDFTKPTIDLTKDYFGTRMNNIIQSVTQPSLSISTLNAHLEPYLRIQLDNNPSNTIADCVARYFGSTELDDGYKFDGSTKFERATQKVQIVEPPKVLYIGLDRLAMGDHGNILPKNTRDVKFAEELDLSPYLSEASKPDMCSQYRLAQVNVHSGSNTGGHYFAVIKDLKLNRWSQLNDNAVSEERNIEQYFGGSRSAVGLMYVRNDVFDETL